VGLETAGGNKAFGLEDGAGNPKSVLPMAVLGLDLYPVLIIQLVEINYPDIQVFHEGGLFLLPPLILAISFFMVVLPSLSKLYR